jgi:CDP-glucose 4,6-dehydratase
VNKGFWKKKKILITGHTGFKGGWLSFFLYYAGCRLYGISLKPKKKSFFYQTKLYERFKNSTFLDINNYNLLKKYLKKYNPEIIFHLAAQPIVLDSYKDPLKTFNTNIISLANLLNISRNIGSIKTILIITSDKCYENEDRKLQFFKETDKLGGNDPYSASKACAEIISKSMFKSFLTVRKKLATVRAGNVIGGGDYSNFRIIPDIFDGIKRNKVVNIRNPHSVRPWQHVMEPIHGYIKLVERLHKSQKFCGPWNFGPEKKNIKSVKQLVLTLTKIKKFKFHFKKKKMQRKEALNLALCIDKIKKTKIWKPKLSFKKSLELTSDWYMKRNKIEITKTQIQNYLNGDY